MANEKITKASKPIILSDEGAERLAVAIVKQAADDYEKALRELLRNPTRDKRRELLSVKAENEAFFRSPYYELLVDIDGERMIRQIQENAVRKEKERVKAKLEKAKKNAAGESDSVEEAKVRKGGRK